jgi:hypothetical protein
VKAMALSDQSQLDCLNASENSGRNSIDRLTSCAPRETFDYFWWIHRQAITTIAEPELDCMVGPIIEMISAQPSMATLASTRNHLTRFADDCELGPVETQALKDFWLESRPSRTL